MGDSLHKTGSMGEFMKIMSTPGDVEEFMESVTQKE